jgi:RNA-binding protein 8A
MGDRARGEPKADDDDDDDSSCALQFRTSAAVRSENGWVVFVTGLSSETTEDDVLDTFSDHGAVTLVKLNPDRRTGYPKGYALVEFEKQAEAQDAINAMHGTEFQGQTIFVDWAFVRPTGHSSSTVRLR